MTIKYHFLIISMICYIKKKKMWIDLTFPAACQEYEWGHGGCRTQKAKTIK